MAIHEKKMSAGVRLRTLGLFGLLLWLPGLPPAGGADANLPRVEPGIEYLHHRIGDGPWSIHVVQVDRSGGRFGLVSTLARDHILGLAGVHEQVASLGPAAGRPVAAINGDFFVIRPGPYQGDPVGLHIVRGELVSAPAGPSFWLDAAGQPHLGPVTARFRATGPAGLDLAFALNEERADDEAVLYTPALGASTRTGPGLELVLERAGAGDWLPLRPGGRYQARIVAHHRSGNAPLTPRTMILSLGPTLAGKLRVPAPGAVISLDVQTTPDLTGVTTAVGGGPVLLEAGQAPDWRPPQPRHSRTALGWDETHFFLVVVDGRQKSLSVGMTFPELAALMRRLGCTHAINLDGGGSATLWLDGHILNSPSDGRERPVANALVVVAQE